MIICFFLVIIVILFLAIVIAYYRDAKKLEEEWLSLQTEFGMSTQFTYKLVDRRTGSVFYIRLDRLVMDRDEYLVDSFVCNVTSGNIGKFRNSLPYLRNMLENCDKEQLSMWSPKPETIEKN